MTSRSSSDCVQNIPKELKEKLAAFDSALTDVEKNLQPLIEANQMELNEKLEALDKAKLELVGAYTINSLFWMYLNVCGVNPKEHSVKQELDRIRSYMNRVREIQDKAKAPKLDKGASKRFVKSALWQPGQKAQGDEVEVQDSPCKSSDTDDADKSVVEEKSKKAAKMALWKAVKNQSFDGSSPFTSPSRSAEESSKDESDGPPRKKKKK